MAVTATMAWRSPAWGISDEVSLDQIEGRCKDNIGKWLYLTYSSFLSVPHEL
jgi:hypothetical protein